MKWSLVVQCLSFFFCLYTSTQTEITCDIPSGEHVLSPTFYFGEDRKLGVSKSYQCEHGYQATAETATCTENGWSPKPLCTEVMCTVPTIENAKTLKKPGTNIEYQCLHGYEPNRFTITCNEQGDWDNMRHCTAKTLGCGPPPSIEHAVQDFKEQYRDGETSTYDCPSNYIKDGDPYMICSRGRWIGKGKCLQINCLLGPLKPGTSTSPTGKNVFRVGESVEITCSETHWLLGTKETKRNIRCKESGEWERLPVCEEITCDIPFDQHVHYPQSYFGGDRRLGVKKSYWCESGYRAETGTATCTENGWLPKTLCSDTACPEPRIENARQLNSPLQPYKPGARIRYQCLHEPIMFEITCDRQGEWKDIQSCPATTLDCDRPPKIEDAVQDLKDRYKDGEKADYYCSAFDLKEGDLTCTRGRWTGSGKCLKPCTVDLKTMDARNLQLSHTIIEKTYAAHGSFITFYCKRGYRQAKHSVPFIQGCTDGRLDFPLCE